MKITDLIDKDDRAGSNSGWQSHHYHESWRGHPGDNIKVITHYGHRMLVFNVDNPHDEEVLDYSIGWGSKSDQDGMNKLFSALNLPLRYQRDDKGGGPRIISLEVTYDGSYRYPEKETVATSVFS